MKREREQASGVMAGLVLGGAAAAGLAAWMMLRPGYSFAGRVVIITGGSRGLGLVMARQLAAEGAKLALLARDAEELRRGAEQVEDLGAQVLAIPCDVADQDEVNQVVEEVVQQFGRVDVLINNAGIIQVGPVEHMTLKDVDESLGVHVYGPLYLTLAVRPHMRRQREQEGGHGEGGRIVNISSIGGLVAVPHLLPYSVGKHALVGLSDGLRHELWRDGIHVTTICPGLMRTGSPRNVAVKGHHEAEYAWFKLGDSLPGVSMSVERAAAKILNACRAKRSRVVLSLPAKIDALMNALTPGVMSQLLKATDRLLPGPDPAHGDRVRRGYESESWVTRSPLTALTQYAAQRNNE